jgi:hypothetical protein
VASLGNALPWHRAYRCYRNPQAASRCLYNEGTMSESVVSFTKQPGQVTPYWLLQLVGEFAETLRQYGLHRVTGDRYSGEFVRELFSERGKIAMLPSG